MAMHKQMETRKLMKVLHKNNLHPSNVLDLATELQSPDISPPFVDA